MMTVFARNVVTPTEFSAYFDVGGIGSSTEASYIRATSNSGALNFSSPQSEFSFSTWVIPDWGTGTYQPSYFVSFLSPNQFGGFNIIALGYDSESSTDSLFVTFNITNSEGQFQQQTYYAYLQHPNNSGITNLPSPANTGAATSWNNTTISTFTNIQFVYKGVELAPFIMGMQANKGTLYWNGQALYTQYQFTSSPPYDLHSTFNGIGNSEVRIGADPVLQYNHNHWQDTVIVDTSNAWNATEIASVYNVGAPGTYHPGVSHLFTMQEAPNWYFDQGQQLTTSIVTTGTNSALPVQDGTKFVP